jgi:predicted DNA-binding transcriptional regulator AlpA
VTKRLLRMPLDGPAMFDLVSHGRSSSQERLSLPQIEQIRRSNSSSYPLPLKKLAGAGRLWPAASGQHARCRYASPEWIRYSARAMSSKSPASTRCTIYRWVCAGPFPPKRAGGGRGWLRSEAERWLSSEVPAPIRMSRLFDV